MELTVTLTANAGLCVTFSGCRFWVDAVHRKPVAGFSSLGWDRFEQVLASPACQNPDFILCTHHHPDHYSRAMTGRALEAFPEAVFLSPIRDFPGPADFEQEDFWYSGKGLHFHFFKLPHEGPQYRDTVTHYGFLVSDGRASLLFPGDCALAAPELLPYTAGVHIDGAVLNFPWGATYKGRNFLNEYIQPDHLLLVHLPFAEDDTQHYRPVTQRSLAKLQVPDVRIMEEFLQTEEIRG